jgi:hypothetical protein
VDRKLSFWALSQHSSPDEHPGRDKHPDPDENPPGVSIPVTGVATGLMVWMIIVIRMRVLVLV